MIDNPAIEQPAIVVTASRAEEEADKSPAAVTLIDAQRIERNGSPLVPDLLRLVPSVAVATSGPAGSLTQVRIRGAEANHTLLFVEGIRANGAWGYFKSWIPDVPKAMYPLIVPLEILGQFMRLISLSVRLYANMLAGHMLILTFLGLIFIIENVLLAVIAVPAAAVFYLFEVVIVVSIQAYIFAALSAIYIGSAIEPDH